MKDLITYSHNTEALLAEAPESLLVKDDEGAVVGLNFIKTPTVRNVNGTLAIVRVDAETLAIIQVLTHISVLSQVDAYGDLLAAMTPQNRAIYDSVHDQTEKSFTDDADNVVSYTPPALIGGFA